MISWMRSALIYLDRHGGLEDILKQCTDIDNIVDKVHYLTILIDPLLLININAKFGNCFLNTPAEAIKVFHEVVYIIVNTVGSLPCEVSKSQIVANCKIKYLPCLPEYRIKSLLDLHRSVQVGRLVQFSAVVVSKSCLHKYTRSTRYICLTANCPGSDNSRHIRLHTPGAHEAQTIRSYFHCTYCSSTLEEVVKHREIGERVVIEVMSKYMLKPHNGISQSIRVYLRDELIRDVSIGAEYVIIGLPVFDSDKVDVIVEVNNIHSVPKVCQMHITVSDPIQFLKKQCENSSWRFVLNLAYEFAGHVTPAGTFLHLKLLLLLSLVASRQNHRERASVNILVLGDDMNLISRILRYALCYADRQGEHLRGSIMTAGVGVDIKGTGLTFITGGSALLANDGIWLVEDIMSLKKTEKQQLEEVLCKKSVYVDLPLDTKSFQKQQTTLNIPCHIWSSISMKTHEPTKTAKLVAAHSFIREFDFWSTVNVEPNSYADYMITQYTSLRALDISPNLLLKENDYQQLLDITSELDADLSPDAEHLIRGYFLASRRSRSTESNTFPLSALSTITELALALCRMNLRSRCTEHDAVLIIWLYEDSFSSLYGHCGLNINSYDHVLDNNLDRYIGVERDMTLAMFHQSLKQFISTHASEMSLIDIAEYREE